MKILWLSWLIPLQTHKPSKSPWISCAPGWCLKTIFHTKRIPDPTSSWREGDAVLVSERQTAKWHGWARGRRLQTSEESRKKEGLFPMAVLRPRLWIAKIETKKEK